MVCGHGKDGQHTWKDLSVEAIYIDRGNSSGNNRFDGGGNDFNGENLTDWGNFDDSNYDCFYHREVSK